MNWGLVQLGVSPIGGSPIGGSPRPNGVSPIGVSPNGGPCAFQQSNILHKSFMSLCSPPRCNFHSCQWYLQQLKCDIRNFVSSHS